ncbi:transcription regulator protein BACH2 isoform X1 [Coccinella septempunctata]|uniref:transcription regulator protein BACH2 isoform X1 n=1 Tax=Coccinella septempunctata TaxID=41139 RepID=UPI001D066B77|nr:transcription regulator protein BACH2 isoform X1 [Coccinella septempunctata]XP_044749857.1 transcription regulator protein BACH2 isoform X1 [Coccinella septempunctata]XP_044749858.1 transcription regulator protein BACH2 isoform X1 [Coccinella septempunctata]
MESLQKYCLRWNNYQTNLVSVFDEMLKNENFADVTVVTNGGDRFRCHRMLLAACSKFFQEIFVSVPCEHHLVVLLKDVRSSDMRHILEYMYTGEVNVGQDEISSIIRTAEELKIKGLTGEDKSGRKDEEHEPMEEAPPSRPSSNHAHTVVHSSSNMHSPPHSTNSMYKNPYTNMYSKMHPNERANMNLPMWHVPGLPHHQPPASESPSSNHFSVPSPPTMMPAYESPNAEVYHHRRKKFSSMMMPKDTPILRTVLGQGQADSSQPVSLVVNHGDQKEEHADQECLKKHMKEEPLEASTSPYSDHHSTNGEDVKPSLSASSPFCMSDMRLASSGIANYVPPQKPEWKRYKQYSRENLNCAIQAVSAGTMSALQAAKKFNVPSRTLYDKVKKLGIVTSKIYRKGTNGNFRYTMNRQTESPYRASESEESPVNNNSRNFLQQAIDNRGEDALKAMAMVAAMHAAASQHQSQPLNQGFDTDPSPALLRYIQQRVQSRSSSTDDENPHSGDTNGRCVEKDEDQVEDLSVNKRQEGVIVSPSVHQVSAIVRNEEVQKEPNEETNRAMCVEETA